MHKYKSYIINKHFLSLIVFYISMQSRNAHWEVREQMENRSQIFYLFISQLFIFCSLPGREKIRYHSITKCIIQHWWALPVTQCASIKIWSQKRNHICVSPKGLRPSVVITVYSCYGFLIYEIELVGKKIQMYF